MTRAATTNTRSATSAVAAKNRRVHRDLHRGSHRRVVVASAARDDSRALKRFEANQPIVNAEGNLSRSYAVVKRTMDVIGATAGVLLLSPIMLTAFVVLTVTTRGQAVFAQERIGFRGRRFQMYKFRTMSPDAEVTQIEVENEQDGPIFKNRRDPRITPFGVVLRRLSIDEMPQLFNVLAGHMTLVGPRPPVAQEVVRYEPWQRRRLAVRPGLTCLWQVSGRSNIGFEDWVRMDIWYINNQNLRTDVSLLIKTPLAVLSCRGAY
jgi:lipopolysaccharide/colanic/teichoic acid biosynthesis glycosyltransferase